MNRVPKKAGPIRHYQFGASLLTLIIATFATDAWAQEAAKDSFGHQALSGSKSQQNATASKAESYGSISGQITGLRTGESLAGITVTLEGTRYAARTDEAGYYLMPHVPAGQYKLIVRCAGAREKRQTIVLSPSQELVANLTLEPLSGTEANTITVTGNRIGTPSASSSPISIVTADDIERKQVTNMTDLLRGEIAGIFVVNPGLNDWTTQVFSRGTTSYNFGFSDLLNDYAKIFIDGVELSRPTLLSMIDPRTIERIETVRGPQAGIIYGADGSSGLMKIVTKKDAASRRGQAELVAQVSAGVMESRYKPAGVTPLIQDHSLQLYGGDDTFGYRLGGNYQTVGEWAPRYNSEAWGLSGGIRAQRGDFTISLSALNFHRELALSSYPDEPQSGEGVDYPMIQTLVAATFDYQPTPNWRHSFTVGQDKNTFSYEGVSFGENTLKRSDYTRQTLRYFTTFNTAIGPNFSLAITAGADAIIYHSNSFEAYGFEYVQGKPNFDNAWDVDTSREDWRNYGYYGMAEIGFRDRLFLTVAARMEEGVRWVAASQRRQFQPRLGLSYIWGNGPVTVKLRGQWGRSVRAPIMDVRNASGYLPNPNIAPNVKEGWDAGFDLSWAKIGTLSVTYFDEKGENLLMPVTIQTRPRVRQYQNVGGITNRGWEFEGNATIGPVSLRGNLIIPDNRWAKSAPGGPPVGTRIASTPQYSGGATVSVRVLKGSASVNGYVLGLRDRGAIKRLNLRAEQPVTKSLTLFGRIDNVLNKQDSERYDFTIAPGRTTVFGVRKTF